MPFFGVEPPPSLCSRRPHRTFVPLLPSCRAISQVETRSLCVHGARCPLGRRTTAALSSRCPAIVQGGIVQVETRLFFALMVLDAILCALAVHIGRLYRSRHRAGRSQSVVETRCLRSRCSTPFSRCWQLPPPLCSRRPHRTFIPLSPSCKAIIQVETLSSARESFPFADIDALLVYFSDASGDDSYLLSLSPELSPGHLPRKSPGFGFWAVRGTKLLYVWGLFTPEEVRALSINALELVTMLWAEITLSPALPQVSHVLAFTDNTAGEWTARRETPHALAMQLLAEHRAEFLARSSLFVRVGRVASADNRWADMLSRQHADEVIAEATALGLTCERLHISEHARDLSWFSCAHGSRYPLWRRPPSLSSRRPHRTFVPLSPSCKAIVQVETRSMRSWYSMPSLASDPAVAELLPSP